MKHVRLSSHAAILFSLFFVGCQPQQKAPKRHGNPKVEASMSVLSNYDQEQLRLTNWVNKKKRTVRSADGRVFTVSHFIRDHLLFTKGNQCYIIFNEGGQQKIIGPCAE